MKICREVILQFCSGIYCFYSCHATVELESLRVYILINVLTVGRNNVLEHKYHILICGPELKLTSPVEIEAISSLLEHGISEMS